MADGPSTDSFKQAIREILLADWDPHNAARMPEASTAYDPFVEPLATMIQAGAGEEAIIDWLHERECETMCFPSLGKQRLVRVARKLLKLGERSQEPGTRSQ
jgi:hypothetical protein